MHTISGGFFSKGRLAISKRDIPQKRGREMESEPTEMLFQTQLIVRHC